MKISIFFLIILILFNGCNRELRGIRVDAKELDKKSHYHKKVVKKSIKTKVKLRRKAHFLDLRHKIFGTSYRASSAIKDDFIIFFKKGKKIPKSFSKVINKLRYKKYKFINAMHIRLSSSVSKSRFLSYLRSTRLSRFIKRVEPNYRYTLARSTKYSPNPYLYYQWGINNFGQRINGISGTPKADLSLEKAWRITKGSKRVVVAILDTGVDYNHPDIRANMYNGLRHHGYDFAADNYGNNDNDPMPDKPYGVNGHFHGTHVAGIIGAVANNYKGIIGVSPRAKILALKVFRPNGSAYSSDILEALDYIYKLKRSGVNIVAINASFAGGGREGDSVSQAIAKLGRLGVVFCTAAGNMGSNISYQPIYPASYNVSNIITVGASNQRDNLASFSNYGSGVDVVAPGTNILSLYPGGKYAFLNGTSMSTPYVTGLVALLASRYPRSSAIWKINRIKATVDRKSSLRGKVYSSGRVNAYRALR